MPKLAYFLLYAVVRLVALLPFFLLYLLSDILYLVVYKIIGYRKKVVRKNLKHSFPSSSKEALRAIEREFYHHFCDLFVETIKLSSISATELKQRFVVKNSSLIEDYFAQGKSCIALSGHYGNWEWSAAHGLYIQSPNKALILYKQVKNESFNKLMLTLRQRFSLECVEKDFALRKMLQYKKQGIQAFTGFVADQTPSARNIHYWTQFMHQDTPVFDGAERIARSMSYALVYIDIQKTKRGFYELEFIPMSDDVSTTATFDMTEKYIRLLEKTIQRNPSYDLWTHKRWKHKRTIK
jgi:Kdo2-lipid IVA lauroyltransferase/acyltransferase